MMKSFLKLALKYWFYNQLFFIAVILDAISARAGISGTRGICKVKLKTYKCSSQYSQSVML